MLEMSSSASVRKLAAPLETQRIDRAMRRYATGDNSAFPELFRLLAPRLHRQLRALCGSDELARELAQETFLRIHRARASFRPELAVLPWIQAIARNCHASHARAWNVRLLRSSVEADDDLLRAEVKDETEARAIARETGRAIARAIARLPACQREVVTLRVQGYSLGDIADELGVSAGAVKLRCFRGSRVLRRTLSRAIRLEPQTLQAA
jgi:RNA polymerase sigma-70 factor (ECF subfamily)